MDGFQINGRKIGPGEPVYIIAEISCNHNQNYETAVKLIKEAARIGVDAVKFQTYTPDTMTLNCPENPDFRINGTIWDGEQLYNLYERAYTPWSWFKPLKELANQLKLDFFSSPFDPSAVDFLEELNVPAYKIASFECTDHVLLKSIAKTGKPVIMSTGMASLSEIDQAIKILSTGCSQIALMKCTSAYPASYRDANLRTIPHLQQTFNRVCGVSDHTLGIGVPLASVVLGAGLVEKHITLDKLSGSPDDQFSLDVVEFEAMVQSIRKIEQMLGQVKYGGVEAESESRQLRRSLYFVRNIKKGEIIDASCIRSIRPGYGLHTRYYDDIINHGYVASSDIVRGTRVAWEYFN